MVALGWANRGIARRAGARTQKVFMERNIAHGEDWPGNREAAAQELESGLMVRMSLFLLLPALALAQGPAASTVSGVDKASMDTSVDPCVDFHQYACGNWIASHPLPADRARFGRFNELQDHNERVELDILQGAAASAAKRSEIDQKIGDFYTSCMDTATINKKGIDPIKPELERIAGLTDM